MLTNFFNSFFQSISDAPCLDSTNEDCLTAINLIGSTAMNVFLGMALSLTLVFILIATLPKYSFKSKIFSDIVLRRIIFIFGFILTLFLLNLCKISALLLCSQRQDSQDSLNAFTSAATIYFYISMVVYPILFWIVAFILNKFFNRRKLYSIFKSNNKIFGLI